MSMASLGYFAFILAWSWLADFDAAAASSKSFRYALVVVRALGSSFSVGSLWPAMTVVAPSAASWSSVLLQAALR